MTIVARLGPWSWPGWPALTVLDFMLQFAPSVASPVQKAFGVVVLLFVNVGFWAILARGAWWLWERFTARSSDR